MECMDSLLGGGPVSLVWPVVLYEDERLLAVDKPAGMVIHPAYRHPDGTLADAVFARQAARGEERPWLLHRLDRDTSGVVLFAKSVEARRALVRQFERRTVGKWYVALLAEGPAEDEGMIEAQLARDPSDRRRVIVTPDGQPAATRFRLLARRAGAALVLVEPLTGRTHQIRAHMASIGAPLIGDALYGGEPVGTTSHGWCAAVMSASVDWDAAQRVMLHAWRLVFRYPTTGEPLTVTAPLPADLVAVATALGLAGGFDDLRGSA